MLVAGGPAALPARPCFSASRVAEPGRRVPAPSRFCRFCHEDRERSPLPPLPCRPAPARSLLSLHHPEHVVTLVTGSVLGCPRCSLFLHRSFVP